VRVRQVDLTASPSMVEQAATLLTPAERKTVDHATPTVRRRRTLLRATLREEIGDAVGVDPDAVPLEARGGRPVWAGNPALDVDASCSASGTVGLVAVVRGARVGVDVEEHRPEQLDEAVLEGWLTHGERAAIAALALDERAAALTRCWTVKEAVLKGRGIGLLGDPRTVVAPPGGRGRVGRWLVVRLPVPMGYEASLAVQPRSPRRGPVRVRIEARP
jgi:4'-phosphopantetheinyl transferase